MYWPIASLLGFFCTAVCKNVLNIDHKNVLHVHMYSCLLEIKNSFICSVLCGSAGLNESKKVNWVSKFLCFSLIQLVFYMFSFSMYKSCNVFSFLCFLAMSLIKHLVDTVFRSQVLVIHSKSRVSSQFQTACQFPWGNILELEKRMVLISVLITDFPHRLKTDKWTNLGCV